MTKTAERMRAWKGPMLFSYGFRPFFLGAAIWAAVAMSLWIAMFAGGLTLPIALDPASWHAHEFLFGYLGAVMAGFLLTAVPNWTGQMPIIGWPLAALSGLWLAGRLVLAVSAYLPAPLVATVDLAFPLVLGLAIAREIVAGRNWRNLIVLAMLGVFVLGNLIFHIEAARGAHAAQGFGLRIGLGAGLAMIGVIGGRIVPSFTRNWMVQRHQTRLPAPPAGRLDRVALAVLVAALALWVMLPAHTVSGAVLILAGVLHLARLARWRGWETLAEPLVTVLHAGYLFLPLGAIGVGIGILWPDLIAPGAAQHLWMGGAVGLMTLAVMTRATLGHTGQLLVAGKGTVAIYLALVGAVLARLGAGIWPALAPRFYETSGLLWIAAFVLCAAIYGPLLIGARPAKWRLGA